MEAFERIDRRRVHQQVADQIRQAIVLGRLSPGESLPTERELSRSFGVSRASIREALRALEAQGLVSLAAGGRWPGVVADDLSGPMREMLVHLVRMERVELWDLVELRTAVESAALARTAGEAGPERLEEARRALEVMRRPGVTVEEFDQADLQFHVSLVAASGNEALHLVMLAVRDAAARYLREALQAASDEGTLRLLSDQHAAILGAVEAGEGPRAADLLRQHIQGFYGKVHRNER